MFVILKNPVGKCNTHIKIHLGNVDIGRGKKINLTVYYHDLNANTGYMIVYVIYKEYIARFFESSFSWILPNIEFHLRK